MFTINLDCVNHFVLQKHHLTDETKIDDIVKITRDIGGLHTTNAITPYLSLFSRIKKFTRDKLDDELYIKKTLGKIRCVRKTVYIHPKERIPITYNATKKMVANISEQYLFKYLRVAQKEYENTSKKIIEILKGRGLTAKEIKEELPGSINISGIVNLMCDQMLLIRGKPQKGWKSNLHTYHIFQEYFPDINLDIVNETDAKEQLVKYYLDAFAPVTENDIAWWTGFTKNDVRGIIEKNSRNIVHVKINGLDNDYIMFSSDEKKFKSIKKPIEPVVNLLPVLDPYMMGYKDRQRYLNHKYYDYIFDRGGNATTTILLNGQVIGIWDFIELTIKIFLFEPIKENTLEQIYSNAKRIGEFISREKVEIKECRSMSPLTKRTAGSVMSPLKND